MSNVLPQVLALKKVPAWLAERGYLSPSGNPISEQTVRHWVRTGRLKPVPGLPRLHFHMEDLERMLQPPEAEQEQEVRRTQHRNKPKRSAEWERRMQKAKEELRQLRGR